MRIVFLVLALTVATTASAASLFEERKPLCLECHGKNGVSTNPEVPSLGGMSELYALLQLVAFREGNRKDPTMTEMVKGMTDDDLRAASAMVAKLTPPPPAKEAGDPARMARGKELAQKHRCGICHKSDFLGGEQMPPLAHQREDYLLKSLRAFKSETRIGDRAAMIEVLYPLHDADFVDLAHYLAHVR